MYQRFANKEFLPIIKDTSREDYLPIDLSINNSEFPVSTLSDPRVMHERIQHYLNKRGKRVAYGGYLEKRALYERSDYFTSSQNQRNIHLGVDFWCDEGISVCCPEQGKIHSFNYNTNFGDYGPTIIIEHKDKIGVFYSLYGHLSRTSIQDLQKGSKVRKGDVVGQIGGSQVNGSYAPHLHFQLIIDMENKEGDYPGVCADDKEDFYKSNCPDPLAFLGM